MGQDNQEEPGGTMITRGSQDNQFEAVRWAELFVLTASFWLCQCPILDDQLSKSLRALGASMGMEIQAT